MILLISLGILLVTGFVTVATETFTNLLSTRSLWTSLREFFLGSWLFSLTATGWAGTVWLGLRWLGIPVSFFWVLEILAFAHLPLLAYPATIIPTIGYRLEQLLRLAVFVTLTGALMYRCDLSTPTAALLALPGWLAHFLSVELRLFRQGDDA